MPDNFRHAQYRENGTQIDDPQKLVDPYIVAASGDTTGTSDVASIQAAIDTASGSGGGTVILAPGVTYHLRAERRIAIDSAWFCLQAKSNVTLNLNGAELLLVSSTCVSGSNNYGGHIIYGKTVDNFIVENGTINGNRTNFTQVPFSGGVTVNGFTILDGEVGCGVRLRASSTNVTIRNCILKNNIYHGALAVEGSVGIKVTSNRITSNGYRAFHYNTESATAVATCDFTDNYVDGNGQSADNNLNSGVFLALGTVADILCIGNIVKNEKFDAISVSGGALATKASRIVIANNSIIGSSAGVTLAVGAANLSFIGNVMKGNGGTTSNIGVRVSNCQGILIANNIIERYGRGISLDTAGTKEVIIHDNNIVDCDQQGIYAGTAAMTGISIQGNAIRDCGLTAASVNSQAIYLEGTMNGSTIQSNLICRAKGNAVLLTDFRKGVIIGNTFQDNYDGVSGGRGRAIFVRSTSDNVRIAHNMIMNQNVTNNVVQIDIEATCTNISVTENYAQGTAANLYVAAVGATGRSYGNTGTASWPVGFLTGAAAL